MAKRKWFWPATIGLAASIVAMVLFVVLRGDGEVMAADDVEEKIASLYGAEEVTDVVDDGDRYNVSFTRSDGEFMVSVDSADGAVVSIEKTGGPDMLSESVMKKKIQEQFGAKPDDLVLEGDVYKATIEEETKTTIVQADALTGEILEESVADKSPAPEDKPTDEADKPEPPPKPPVRLTENEAVAIALEEVPGQLDDVDYEESDSGGYFLIQIESGEREAEVQVHAISREVISLIWDD